MKDNGVLHFHACLASSAGGLAQGVWHANQTLRTWSPRPDASPTADRPSELASMPAKPLPVLKRLRINVNDRQEVSEVAHNGFGGCERLVNSTLRCECSFDAYVQHPGNAHP